MKSISLPTAIVLAAFIVGWVALAVVGKPIPAWMAAAGAIAGKVILAFMQSLAATPPAVVTGAKTSKE